MFGAGASRTANLGPGPATWETQQRKADDERRTASRPREGRRPDPARGQGPHGHDAPAAAVGGARRPPDAALLLAHRLVDRLHAREHAGGDARVALPGHPEAARTAGPAGRDALRGRLEHGHGAAVPAGVV